ncbi:hypothetical protein K2173_016596 [Erythroxylum novogranatense]|uniref:OVATE domain-containing protein n=1 Tax=Erythroxylum novogranatense TaxID=1862640 RepID=A0AAV8SHI4_9ROSI|nr:hypothetical protein K2173_016596 [Erythroxylum novogranatense]
MKALVAFRYKLFSPCRRLFLAFRLKLRKPVLIRSLRSHTRRSNHQKAPPKKRIFNPLFSVFRRRSRKMDRLAELMNSPKPMLERQLFPSPLTPAYIKASNSKATKNEAFGNEDIEDACRSFENYLVDVIVEEGKVRDLMDVEELLYCWKNLKCPVFIDLVSRFYGELCRDLFSPDDYTSSDIASS